DQQRVTDLHTIARPDGDVCDAPWKRRSHALAITARPGASARPDHVAGVLLDLNGVSLASDVHQARPAVSRDGRHAGYSAHEQRVDARRREPGVDLPHSLAHSDTVAATFLGNVHRLHPGSRRRDEFVATQRDLQPGLTPSRQALGIVDVAAGATVLRRS